MFDFGALATQLLADARTVLSSWFPQGRVRGNEFIIGNLFGDAGESLSINLTTGVWADFATGDKGSDLIALYAAARHLKMGEAAKELGAARTPVPARGGDTNVILPVPADAPVFHGVHRRLGKPSAIWTYKDESGRLLGHVARYDAADGKHIQPWTYTTSGWRCRSWPTPRPLYGLEDLHRQTAWILIVEGEKCVEAARRFPGVTSYSVVTWPNGAESWQKVDYGPLRGRRVLLWPDADKPGRKCMLALAHHLLSICAEVRIILSDERDDGWDAADALAEGWDWAKVQAWASTRVQTISRANGKAHDTVTISAEAKWIAWNLDRNGKGEPLANLNNAVRVLECEPTLKKRVWLDTFLQRIMTETDSQPREWIDPDDIHLCLTMQRDLGITKMSREHVGQAVIELAHRDQRHCVRDYLETLIWDGESRIEDFFSDHFGAANNVYTRAVSRNFWLCLVARVYRPGCKLDNMVILEGAQGLGKSHALQIIGGDWFSEQHESLNSKDFYQVLQGKWLIEVGEMDAFSRGDITKVKQVITNPSDYYRPSYARYAKNHPRQCVFVGTTNRDDYLRDETGARRFWPIQCSGSIDIDAIAAHRNDFFAEAVSRVKAGEHWWEMPWDETRFEQESRYQTDAWQGFIEEFLFYDRMGDQLLPRAVPREEITTSEILTDCLKFDRARIGKGDEMRVGNCLRVLGYSKSRKRNAGRLLRAWVAPSSGEAGPS